MAKLPKSKATSPASSTLRRKSLQDRIAEVIAEYQNEVTPSGRVLKESMDTSTGTQIHVWEDDPFLTSIDGAEPVPADPITDDLPENDHQNLQTQILDEKPVPGLFEPGSSEFLYWNGASALARGINFWAPNLPAETVWSSASSPLKVELDHQDTKDLNAFYDRASGLNFFHDTVLTPAGDSVKVFSGESPDIVCHELGHAILDAVKPELWDALSGEVGAFHEGFADCSALLSSLQFPTMRQFVLHQTGGQLDTNSRLSQTARQLGWAIRLKFGPDSADSDSLRNLANKFFYQDPATLPSSAPSSQLSSEVHSFSRVFSGAFLDVLARMFHVGPGNNDDAKLEKVANDAGRILIEGVRLAQVGPGFYGQVAASMIQADHTLNGGKYGAALTSSFVKRGILSPSSAVSLVRDVQTQGGKGFGVAGLVAGRPQLQFEGDREGYKKSGQDLPALPLRPLTTRFGVTFFGHLPAEPNRFAVVSAAVSGGGAATSSPEEDARSFVEDLIQRDRIDHEGAEGVLPTELTSPAPARPCQFSHYFVKEGNRVILKRRRFVCRFCRR
jgi:hypothetical protein